MKRFFTLSSLLFLLAAAAGAQDIREGDGAAIEAGHHGEVEARSARGVGQVRETEEALAVGTPVGQREVVGLGKSGEIVGHGKNNYKSR